MNRVGPPRRPRAAANPVIPPSASPRPFFVPAPRAQSIPIEEIVAITHKRERVVTRRHPKQLDEAAVLVRGWRLSWGSVAANVALGGGACLGVT